MGTEWQAAATGQLLGRLLVATPALTDPNFDRTVVLVLQHDAEDGTMGIVLNRPSPLSVDDHLDGWGVVAPDPPNLFLGGPVHPEVAIAAATTPRDQPLPDEIQALTDFAGVVDLTLDPAMLVDRVVVRIFAGYAGWSPGQLADEIAEGAWWVVEARRDDLVTTAPQDLWRRVLRRQHDERSLASTYPEDISLN